MTFPFIFFAAFGRIKTEEFKIIFLIRITEVQNGWGWKGPLEVKQGHLEPDAQNHVQTAFDYPDSFLISPGTETPQPLWAAYFRARSPSQYIVPVGSILSGIVFIS